MKAPLQLATMLAVGAVLMVPGTAVQSAEVQRNGTEFPLTQRLPGDQVNARLALGPHGGLIVWQDAAIDGDGLGISAMRLSNTLSPDSGGPFRVNEASAHDQENARVVLLPGGGALIVWQGGPQGFTRIFGRVLGADGTFSTSDIPISSGAGEHQLDPDVAVLKDGNVIVVWSSYRQDGSHYDVFGRIFSPSGVAVSGEFRVNQGLGLGRRSPSVLGSPNGGFLVVWAGERIVGERDFRNAQGQRVPGAGAPIFEVALYARGFDSNGTPTTGDNRVAGQDAIAAHPALAPLPGGKVALAWSRRDPQSRSNSLDIASLVLNSSAVAEGPERIVNTFRYGDQYRPSFASTTSGALLIWSSMGQDSSWEGVYGTWLNAEGVPAGEELQLNTTVGGGQVLPTAAATPSGQILVAWSSNLPRSGLEVFGQRLETTHALAALPAPYVSALSSSELMVSWTPATGLEVAKYRVFRAGGEQLSETAESYSTIGGLAPAGSVAVEVSYVLASGEESPRSPSATGKTWGADKNFDGLPDDWQETYWTAKPYPAGGEDSDGDGVRNLDEWLAGTDPTDASSVLRITWKATALGIQIEWPTKAGYVYQLQSSSDGTSWKSVGGPRFAAQSRDSVTLPAADRFALYRILRVR